MYEGKKKRVQIMFRLTKLAWEKLEQVAEIFNMEPSRYVKAMFYRDLVIPRASGSTSAKMEKESNTKCLHLFKAGGMYIIMR